MLRRPAVISRLDLGVPLAEDPIHYFDATRQGNTIMLRTRGVAELTLLLSPDVFDLQAPIRVTADGKTVFEGRVEANVQTLLKWAARDNDRTMLYGAELKVKL